MSTIASISTAPGIGGIGIVRLSGENTFEVIQKIFKPKKKQKIEEIKGYTLKYGVIVEEKEVLDEVLVSYFKEPKSYTAENMCEINSHGGMIVLQKILDLCLKNGAVLAEPGEFTKRAFLNGRIDLSQAESVIEVINAKTEKELKASIHQLEGYLSKDIEGIREEVMSVLVDIEASIDYPEYDVPEVTNQKAIEKLERAKEKIERLENSFKNGKLIKQGIKVAIIGKPNAGKSSLLNAILREEKAIVTEYEGTTRDVIDGFVSVQGIPLQLIDTAGIREAKDEVEKIGITKSKKMAEEADVLLVMLDASKELTEEDEEILNLAQNKKHIVLLNKADQNIVVDKNHTKLKEKHENIMEISALNHTGIENVYDKIAQMFHFNEITLEDSSMITNIRHKEALQKAKEEINKSIETISSGMPIDITSIYMKNILEELGSITGVNVSEDILKEIFSKFCLGK